MIKKCFWFAALVIRMAASAATANEFRGVVSKVDSESKELVVDGRGPGARGLSLGFSIGADTRIQVGREPGKLSDLQPGERVRLLYEVRDGKRVALAITATSLGKKPAAGANPAAPAATAPDTLTGSLARVGLTEREIVVIGPGPKGEKEVETTLLVPKDVKVNKEQKAANFEDLKEGDSVTVRMEMRGGKLTAAAIQTGGTAPPRAATENKRIERIRQALKLADWILQQMEEQQGKP